MTMNAWHKLRDIYEYDEVGHLPYKILMRELRVYEKELEALGEERAMQGAGMQILASLAGGGGSAKKGSPDGQQKHTPTLNMGGGRR